MTEEIGRHKGAVETLLHEKKELSRILKIVNSQLERHLSALEEAGVDTDQFIEQLQKQSQQRQQTQQKRQETAQRQQEKQSGKQQDSQPSSSSQDNKNSDDDERDVEDYFEDDDDDLGNRDFNPNR